MGTSKYVTIIRKANPHASTCQTVQMNLPQCIVCVKRPLCAWSPSVCSLEDKKFPRTLLAILFRSRDPGLGIAMPRLNTDNVRKTLERSLRFIDCIKLK